MDLTYLLNAHRIAALVIMSLTSMPIHEWAHAWVAFQLGDDTAALQGRLTLNPLAHIDPLGTLALVFLGYGWGKPVPVNPYRFRGNMRAGRALVSFAGPFSNFLLAMLAAIPFRLGLLRGSSDLVIAVQRILIEFMIINLGLMLFNLIPIPPLDGSRILAWLLPRDMARLIDDLERYGAIVLMMSLFLLSRLGVFSVILTPVLEFFLQALLLW